jgi:hypothetical protein
MCSISGTVGGATVETNEDAAMRTGMAVIGLVARPGIINITVAGGSTTGTWKHYLRYKPLGRGVTVTAAF